MAAIVPPGAERDLSTTQLQFYLMNLLAACGHISLQLEPLIAELEELVRVPTLYYSSL